MQSLQCAIFRCSHEIGASPDSLRPAGDVVENLVDDVVGDYVAWRTEIGWPIFQTG
jgi:hypothetical protein